MGFLFFLETLPWSLGVLFLVLIFTLFTTIGICLIRYFVDPKTLRSHHDVAGVVFTNLGVLYAVLVGFIVVNVQTRYDKIEQTIQVEASYIEELYQDSKVFSEQDKLRLRNGLYDYGISVIEDEWPIMAKGEVLSMKTMKAMRELLQAYYDVDLQTTKQQLWYSESINKLNLLLNARLTRLMESKASLGTEIWSFLIIGGIVMVAFTWMFAPQYIFPHILMSSLLAASTAFMLFLIYSLDTAFSGTVSINPDAIEAVIKTFNITY